MGNAFLLSGLIKKARDALCAIKGVQPVALRTFASFALSPDFVGSSPGESLKKIKSLPFLRG